MALLAGFAVGLFGAIPPGPVNFNVIRKASQNQTREALRVALGAALVDTVICGFVAMGFGWVLEKVVNNPWTRLGLALFLYGVGVQYGKQFFTGLVSASGRRANLIALIGVLCAGAGYLVFRRGDLP